MTSPEGRTRDDVVHDLRNAINCMALSASCIAQTGDLPPECHQFAKAIQESSVRARELIDEYRGVVDAPRADR